MRKIAVLAICLTGAVSMGICTPEQDLLGVFHWAPAYTLSSESSFIEGAQYAQNMGAGN